MWGRLIGWICGLLVSASAAMAAPFAVTSEADFRVDATTDWAANGDVHNTPLALPAAAFPTTDGGPDIDVYTYGASILRIWNAPGLTLPGVLLQDSGPEPIVIGLNRNVQGFGLYIEHLDPVPATYSVEAYSETDAFLFTFTVNSPGSAGEPAFIGAIDPESRIRNVVIRGDPANTIAISEPLLTLAPGDGPTNPALLPIAASAFLPVDPDATYLHEGVAPAMLSTPATQQATTTNANAHRLQDLFSDLRPGDFIALRVVGNIFTGGAPNGLAGVLASTEALGNGSQFDRVPSAIEAGIDVFTPSASPVGGIPTPTDIPEDFWIGAAAFIPITDQARYLFLSRQRPSPIAGPLQVRVDHIKLEAFRDWAAAFGLHGALALAESDLDDDGLTLIEEFAYLKNPTVSDSAQVDTFSAAPSLVNAAPGNPLTLRFAGRINAPFTRRAEFSSDLNTWIPAPEPSLVPIMMNGDTEAVFEVLDPAPGNLRFGRVRTEYISR